MPRHKTRKLRSKRKSRHTRRRRHPRRQKGGNDSFGGTPTKNMYGEPTTRWETTLIDGTD